MKKLILSIMLIAFSINMCNAQLLWEVSKRGYKTSYLFGTHHLVPVTFLDSINGVYKAFNNSNTIVGEIVMDEVMSAKLIQKMMMTQDADWCSLMSQEDLSLLDQFLTNYYGVDHKAFAMLQPAVLNSMILVQKYLECTGTKQQPTMIDSFFQTIGAQQNKEILGLETIDDQVKVLTYGTIESQVEDLARLLNNKDICTANQTLVNLYRAGDLDGLEEYTITGAGDEKVPTEEYLNVILYNRNTNWIEQLPKLFKKNSCFVAVGCLHLAGNKGLIELLKKQGFKVKPYMPKENQLEEIAKHKLQ